MVLGKAKHWCALQAGSAGEKTPDPRAIGVWVFFQHSLGLLRRLFPRTDRPSYKVAIYLIKQGYRIIPLNLTEKEILGGLCHPDLASIPEEIE